MSDSICTIITKFLEGLNIPNSSTTDSNIPTTTTQVNDCCTGSNFVKCTFNSTEPNAIVVQADRSSSCRMDTWPTLLQPLPSIINLSITGCTISASKIPFSIISTSFPSLKSLNLSGNRITGNLTPDISVLSNLTVLDLSNNIITGVLPSELSLLTSLETLNLSQNLFVGLIPPFINTLPLQYLNLGGNSLRGNLPPLTNLTKLTYCNFTPNQKSLCFTKGHNLLPKLCKKSDLLRCDHLASGVNLNPKIGFANGLVGAGISILGLFLFFSLGLVWIIARKQKSLENKRNNDEDIILTNCEQGSSEGRERVAPGSVRMGDKIIMVELEMKRIETMSNSANRNI